MIYSDTDFKQKLNLKGYTLLNLLDINEVEILNQLCGKYLDSANSEFVATSHFLKKYESEEIFITVKEILGDRMELLFPELELLGATFATKRKGNTVLEAHRDWTIVDENKYNSYNLWIPLVDTNKDNGTLGFIESSHINCHEIRGHNICNPHAKKTNEYLKKSVEPILKAGQAILYDHRLIHFSRPNKTTIDRNVVIIGLKPKEAQLRVSIGTNKNTFETYEVDTDDFYQFDSAKIQMYNQKIS